MILWPRMVRKRRGDEIKDFHYVARDGEEEGMTEFMQVFTTIFGIVAVFLGVVIPLMFHLDNKTDKKIDAIHAEMKDFHERLLEIERRRG